MTGAIEFLRAWQDLCSNTSCADCPAYKICRGNVKLQNIDRLDFGMLVKQVMLWERSGAIPIKRIEKGADK